MATEENTGDSFAVLAVQLPPMPSYPVTAVHEMRIRRNAPKLATANDSRSLFIKNVPADSTEAHFRALFTSLVGAGRFETVTFEGDEPSSSAVVLDPARAMAINGFAKKRKRGDVEAAEAEEERTARLPELWTRPVHASGATAVALLADDRSVALVLKAAAKAQRTGKLPVWGEGVAPGSVSALGPAWVSTHLQLSSRADKLATKTAVHAFFNVFNRKEREAAELAKRLRNEPDDDGFVTVTRGSSRTAPASRTEADEARRRMLEKEAKKKEGMEDFYRFQLRQRRKEEQAELIKRFAEDRKKVDAMREKRGKFRPET